MSSSVPRPRWRLCPPQTRLWACNRDRRNSRHHPLQCLKTRKLPWIRFGHVRPRFRCRPSAPTPEIHIHAGRVRLVEVFSMRSRSRSTTSGRSTTLDMQQPTKTHRRRGSRPQKKDAQWFDSPTTTWSRSAPPPTGRGLLGLRAISPLSGRLALCAFPHWTVPHLLPQTVSVRCCIVSCPGPTHSMCSHPNPWSSRDRHCVSSEPVSLSWCVFSSDVSHLVCTC
mmetsp:Transcript_69051/g.162473  ORF Transcript_69051/g.162473 Transcript_69051/m.162473 type:complete len:224 (-) Transcript_69051:831-1502(-)